MHVSSLNAWESNGLARLPVLTGFKAAVRLAITTRYCMFEVDDLSEPGGTFFDANS